MVLVRWDPWVGLGLLQRQMDAAFGPADAYTPAIDAYRTDSGLSFRIELPGVQPEDVEVSFADGRVKISGERRTDQQVEEGQWVRRERSVGRFERTFALPRGTDPDLITATFEHGVLHLEVPHAPDQQPHKIAVTAGSDSQ